MPPAEVDAALTRVEGLMKAIRPMLKAKRIDWHRVDQLLRMARDQFDEPCSTILDWDIAQMREERDRAE